MHTRPGTLDWADLERTDRRAHEAARDRRGLERARHDHRRRARGARSRTRAARWSSSTRCTTRRTRSSTCAPSTAISSRARRTSSTVRTSACCTGSTSCSQRSTCAQARSRARHGARSLETGTLNFEALVGAAAADRLSRVARRQRGEATLAREARARVRRDCTRAASRSSHQLWNGLAAIRRRARCYGPPPSDAPRTPTVSFTVAGVDSRTSPRDSPTKRRLRVERRLLRGDHRRAAGYRRPDGVVRAGCACYTTAEEVERRIAASRRLQSARAALR